MKPDKRGEASRHQAGGGRRWERPLAFDPFFILARGLFVLALLIQLFLMVWMDLF